MCYACFWINLSWSQHPSCLGLRQGLGFGPVLVTPRGQASRFRRIGLSHNKRQAACRVDPSIRRVTVEPKNESHFGVQQRWSSGDVSWPGLADSCRLLENLTKLGRWRFRKVCDNIKVLCRETRASGPTPGSWRPPAASAPAHVRR